MVQVPVPICVFLIRVWGFGAIVPFVEDSIIVHIRITGISHPISVGIFLIKIGNRRTIITRISPFVITIGLSVFLVRIGHQWTIVRSVRDAIIVRVVIASVTDTVPIGVLLSRIWCFGTIVLTTFLLKIIVFEKI